MAAFYDNHPGGLTTGTYGNGRPRSTATTATTVTANATSQRWVFRVPYFDDYDYTLPKLVGPPDPRRGIAGTIEAMGSTPDPERRSPPPSLKPRVDWARLPRRAPRGI